MQRSEGRKKAEEGETQNKQRMEKKCVVVVGKWQTGDDVREIKIYTFSFEK